MARYDNDLGAQILDDAEVAALMDRAFAKVIGKEFRQVNGAPPIWIQDSLAIIRDDYPHLFGKTDPR